MINGIRHGVEGLTHGRKLLTIVLWELDAEILLRDLPELKRHLLKRPQTADNGEEHDGRDCKQKHDAGDHIRRSDLIQKPQDLYRRNADGAPQAHAGGFAEQEIPASSQLSRVAGVVTGICQLTLLLRVQMQCAFRQDHSSILVKQVPERTPIVGKLSHDRRDRGLVDNEDHRAKRVCPPVIGGKDDVQIRRARGTLYVRAAFPKCLIACQIVFIQPELLV